MFVETLLKRIEDEQLAHARQSLAAPGGHDGYDYGRAAGIYAGLGKARDILIEMVSEADDRDAEL